jgi:hypothetical protein
VSIDGIGYFSGLRSSLAAFIVSYQDWVPSHFVFEAMVENQKIPDAALGQVEATFAENLDLLDAIDVLTKNLYVKIPYSAS